MYLGIRTNDLIIANDSGTEKVRFEQNGNVGIGTSSNISSPLTIQSNGAANGISIIGRDNGSSDEALISFYEYDGTTRNAYILKEAGNLAFATGTGGSPAERLHISNDGTVIVTGAAGNANKGILQLSTQAATYQLLGGNNLGYLGYKTGGYHRWFGSDGVEEMRLSGDVLTIPGHATNGGTPLILGSTGVTQYTDLILKSNSGTAEFFKAGTGYTAWGGAAALNIYNSNEKIAFHPSGQQNVVQMTSAGIVMGVGKGISFAANANATGMSSEILDDYEEGTWTPTVIGGTPGYSIRTGLYTKIGNLVRLRCSIKLSSWSGSSTVSISGLPFSSVSSAYNHDWGAIHLEDKPNASVWVAGASGATVFFRRQDVASQDTPLAHTDIDANTGIMFTVVYQTTA
jgi:hypothetical protein